MQIGQLHFIRPEWLLAFVPLLILWWFFYKKQLLNSNWSNIIDAHLLQVLATKSLKIKKSYLTTLLALIFSLLILALSGPSFQKRDTAIYELQKLDMLLLDVSPSMVADDIKPSRLKRGIILIKQFLKQHQEGEVMLIAFSAEPYVISPPTADRRAILNLLTGLDQNTLPKAGSRLDLALIYAHSLSRKYASKKINILLLTDAQNISAKAFDAAKALNKAQYNLSIIALATPNRVSFKNHQQKNVSTKLNQNLLRLLAKTGGGIYQLLGNDIENIKTYVDFSKQQIFNAKTKQKDNSVSHWVDSGIYLALALLPLSLLLFKQGYFSVLLLVVLLFPADSYAKTYTLFNSLWQTPNQAAAQEYENKNYQQSADLFKNPAWRASALYKAGEFESAATLFNTLGQNYNYANALAQQQEFQKAVDNYRKIDKKNPNYENAMHNLALVKKLLAQQKQQKNEQQGDDKDSKKSDKKGDKKDGEQQKGDKKDDKKDSQQQQEDDKKGDEKTAKKTSEAEKEKNLKQQEADLKQQEENLKAQQEKQQAVIKQQKKQIDKQHLQQIFKQVKTRPIDLLRQKFKIERAIRQKNNSELINQQKQISW